MKKTFTFLLFGVISLSLLGQDRLQEQDIKEFKQERISKTTHKAINAFDNQRPRNPEYASRSLTRHSRYGQGSLLKSGLAAKKMLDSLLGELYDADLSQWLLNDRELFSYDTQGNMTTYVWYSYDSEAMEILPFDKETVKYNDQGQPTEILWMIWDPESGQWQNFGKFELSYDDKGNLVKEVISDWDPEAEKWQVGVQFEMTYDSQGQILSELWSYWDEELSALVETYRDEYIYEEGKLTYLDEYIWEEGEWALFFRTTYTYDDSGNLIEEFTRLWEPSFEQWIDVDKSLYTYNEANQLVIEEVWEFDFEQFMMFQTWQYHYVWDSDGNLTEQVDKEWDAGIVKGTDSWQDAFKYVWTFNKDFTISEIYAPYWFQDPDNLNFTHMPVSETDYVFVDGDWVMDYRQTASYSDVGESTGVNEAQASQINIYPIPAAEQLTFSWEDSYGSLVLEVYDLTGKRVISRAIDNNEIIGVDQLSGGIYLYKLMDNSQLIFSGKISVE